jgi:hypothetical protein
MIYLIDYWQIERDGFEGEGCLVDAEAQNTAVTSARAIARLFLIRAATGVVDGLTAASYYAALLAVEDPEAGALRRCLLALQQNDTAALAGALGEAACFSAVHLASRSARSLAELSYSMALEVGAWEHAHFAARLLERLATLDECTPAADRWAVRADIQLRRVQCPTGHVR